MAAIFPRAWRRKTDPWASTLLAYTRIVPYAVIEYDFGDRHARVDFVEDPEGVTVTVAFDPESEHPEEMQRDGWQAILTNFKRHVESKGKSRPALVDA